MSRAVRGSVGLAPYSRLHMRYHIFHIIHIFIIKRHKKQQQQQTAATAELDANILHFQLGKKTREKTLCRELSAFEYVSFHMQHTKFKREIYLNIKNTKFQSRSYFESFKPIRTE